MPDDPEQVADRIILELGWDDLADDIKSDLDNAYLGGIADALLTASVSPSHFINSANSLAQSYAQDQAASLVTMITDTTREKLKDIITAAFEEETDIDDLISSIDESGIFGASRSRMIARTEVNRAERGGNIAAWETMGNVQQVNWVNGEEACDVCQELEDGSPYSLEEAKQLMDDTHPNCRCGLVPYFEEEEK